MNLQSSKVCCIMIIADALDNKHLYEDVFQDYYQWGEKLRLEGLPQSPFGPALKPFQVTHTTDMKAAWYLSKKGGGCKSKTLFCHLCSCSKNMLTSHSVLDSRCDCCKHRNREKCYHHEVCDSVRVTALLDDLERQLGNYYETHKKPTRKSWRKQSYAWTICKPIRRRT